MSSTLFVGTVLTLDEAAPRAGAVLVIDGRISAVGTADDLRAAAPEGTDVVDLDDGALMPGLIEPHGHPTSSAVLVSHHVIDIRPVIVADADEVMGCIRDALAARPQGVIANGWDPLLQRGLQDPTLASLDELAGSIPLVIVHNSGHTAFFNSAAAAQAGITRDTPDPAGAQFVHNDAGELAGVALEAGAVFAIAGPFLNAASGEFGQLMTAELQRANAVGVTTIADMSWNPAQAPLLATARARHEFTARLRFYEMSHPGGTGAVPIANGDDIVRQIGIKTWADGSPWVGNIATSFPYLTNATTKRMGLEPDHHGSANFTGEQLRQISLAYAKEGWQLACHAHGDLAIDSVLDAWESVIDELALTDHRFRLEHVGAMTRLSNSGRRLDGAAGVSLDAALRAHTVNAAWQLRSEDHIGSIEVGKYADLIVVDRDPHAVSAEALAATRVLSTYSSGALVYEAS